MFNGYYGEYEVTIKEIAIKKNKGVALLRLNNAINYGYNIVCNFTLKNGKVSTIKNECHIYNYESLYREYLKRKVRL